MMFTLIPTQYKIGHSSMEFPYSIKLIGDYWVVELSGTRNYLTKSFTLDDYRTGDIAMFGTPERALAFWEEYISRRG